MYCGVLVENNRRHGVHFVGGFHSLVDSVCRENAMDQVRVDRGSAAHMRVAPDNPLLSTTVYLCNNILIGGRYGVAATAGGVYPSASVMSPEPARGYSPPPDVSWTFSGAL